MTLAVPSFDSPHLRKLVDRLGTGTAPVTLKVQPERDAQLDDCFGNVARKITRDGGAVMHGWQVWEWPDVLIEGEFHAVWQSPAGDLVDVSPKRDAEQVVMFVADPSRQWMGTYVDNVRLALRDDGLIDHVIRLSALITRLMNNLQATSPGNAEAEQNLQMAFAARQAVGQKVASGHRDQDDCFCGKRRAYTRCHGALVNQMLRHFAA